MSTALAIVCFLASNNPIITVPTELLLEYNVQQSRIGFVHKNHIYITYLHVISKIDMSGNQMAFYNKKGQGPGERMGGPMFMFNNELWCQGVMTNKMLILDENLEFNREIPFRDMPSYSSIAYQIAPGENAIYVLLMQGVQEGEPVLVIQQRSPLDFSIQKEYALRSIPLSKKQISRGSVLGLNYLGDNLFAIYQACQPQQHYEIYLWDSKNETIKTLSHLTPQLPPDGTEKHLVPSLMVSGASNIQGVYREEGGFSVFFNAKEIDKNKHPRERNWLSFTHHFDTSLNPKKTGNGASILLFYNGFREAALLLHPDQGVEVAPL